MPDFYGYASRKARIMAMRRSLAILIVALVAGTALAKETKPAVSLRYSCSDKPFLSISVSTLHRDSFPDVQLRLIDPLGRALGFGVERKRIPTSHYGKVIEIPGHEAMSRVVAAEVCEAMQGDYAVVVSEHANEDYRLAVRADDGSVGNEAQSSWFQSRQGQTCTFRFRVLMANHTVSVRWLSTDHVQTFSPDPACELAAKH